MNRYTIILGANNLGNVRKLVIVADKDTPEHTVLDATRHSYPNGPILSVKIEKLLNVGQLISEERIGTWTQHE
jgi:hypothetical protein